jgi:hypothetical protein
VVGVMGWRFDLKVGAVVRLIDDVWLLWSAAREAWGCVEGENVWGRERREGCQHVK